MQDARAEFKTEKQTFIWLYFPPYVCVGAPTVQAHALRLNDNSKLAVTVNVSVNVSFSLVTCLMTAELCSRTK